MAAMCITSIYDILTRAMCNEKNKMAAGSACCRVNTVTITVSTDMLERPCSIHIAYEFLFSLKKQGVSE